MSREANTRGGGRSVPCRLTGQATQLQLNALMTAVQTSLTELKSEVNSARQLSRQAAACGLGAAEWAAASAGCISSMADSNRRRSDGYCHVASPPGSPMISAQPSWPADWPAASSGMLAAGSTLQLLQNGGTQDVWRSSVQAQLQVITDKLDVLMSEQMASGPGHPAAAGQPGISQQHARLQKDVAQVEAAMNNMLTVYEQTAEHTSATTESRVKYLEQSLREAIHEMRSLVSPAARSPSPHAAVRGCPPAHRVSDGPRGLKRSAVCEEFHPGAAPGVPGGHARHSWAAGGPWMAGGESHMAGNRLGAEMDNVRALLQSIHDTAAKVLWVLGQKQAAAGQQGDAVPGASHGLAGHGDALQDTLGVVGEQLQVVRDDIARVHGAIAQHGAQQLKHMSHMYHKLSQEDLSRARSGQEVELRSIANDSAHSSMKLDACHSEVQSVLCLIREVQVAVDTVAASAQQQADNVRTQLRHSCADVQSLCAAHGELRETVRDSSGQLVEAIRGLKEGSRERLAEQGQLSTDINETHGSVRTAVALLGGLSESIECVARDVRTLLETPPRPDAAVSQSSNVEQLLSQMEAKLAARIEAVTSTQQDTVGVLPDATHQTQQPEPSPVVMIRAQHPSASYISKVTLMPLEPRSSSQEGAEGFPHSEYVATPSEEAAPLMFCDRAAGDNARVSEAGPPA